MKNGCVSPRRLSLFYKYPAIFQLNRGRKGVHSLKLTFSTLKIKPVASDDSIPLVKSERPRTTSPQKVAEVSGNSLISGKSRLVKYYSIWPDFVFGAKRPIFKGELLVSGRRFMTWKNLRPQNLPPSARYWSGWSTYWLHQVYSKVSFRLGGCVFTNKKKGGKLPIFSLQKYPGGISKVSYCWWFRNPAFTSWYGSLSHLFTPRWFFAGFLNHQQ